MNEWQKIVNVILKEHVPVMNPQVSTNWSCMCGAQIGSELTWATHLVEMIQEAK